MANAPKFFARIRIVREGDFRSRANELPLTLKLDDAWRRVRLPVVIRLFLLGLFNVGFGEALRFEHGSQIWLPHTTGEDHPLL